ncbi:MFS transporter [Paenibacillus glycinis]|uniref:MFS transporter n=1 Tax=Paenibacillus glycinis TaxID=2697035 RepID=UPI0038B3D648
MFGLVAAFAPAIGPALSGWIIDNYSWRVLFEMLLPVAVLDLVAAVFLLRNVTALNSPKIDVLSIVLSSLGFGGLLYGSSIAGTAGWGSPEVVATLAGSILALTGFIYRQLKLKSPMLEFRVFRYGKFTLSTLLVIIVFIALLGELMLLPIYTQNMLGCTALESGLMLMPGGIIMGILSPVTGKIYDKIGAKWLAIMGLSIVAFSTFMLTHLEPDTSLLYLAIVNSLTMIGVAMVLMPLTTSALNQLPSRLIPHGTAMTNTLRQVAGAIGSAVLINVMTNSALDPVKFGIDGSVHGVNVAFEVVTYVCLAGLILALFEKRKSERTSGTQYEAMENLANRTVGGNE